MDGCASCPLLGRPTLTVDREPPGIRLSWDAAVHADVYDVVEGSLSVLRASGDVAAATSGCPATLLSGTSLHLDPPDPAPGDGTWSVVGSVSHGCRGSFEDPGPAPSGARDLGIRSSTNACP